MGRIVTSVEDDRPHTSRTVLRWTAWIAVPVAVFLRQIGWWTLNPLAAPRMMTGDWTTYIIAPNYLRSAPLLTWPLGRVPGYISPPGISLALADANPLALPLYRLGNALSPDRPVQFLGWFILVAYVLTFITAVRLIETGARHLRNSSRLGTVDRLIAGALAGVLLLMPMYALRWIHVSLTNQWVVILALHLALFDRAVTRRGALLRAGLVLLATAIQPYLTPMVVAVTVPWLFEAARQRPWRAALATLAGGLGVLGVAATLGYIGGGARADAQGYGSFPADLSTIISPRGYGRWLPNLAHRPRTNTEGVAFVGLGALLLVVIGAVLVLRRPAWRRRLAARRGLIVVCVLLYVWAAMPRLRLFGWEIVDLTGTPLALTPLGQVFRVNGRFVWPLVWLLAMLAGAALVAWSHRLRWLAAVLIVAVQVVNTKPEHVPSTSVSPYLAGRAVLRSQAQLGVRAIEMQPPMILKSCYPKNGLTFPDVAPVALAAAVEGIPINSGYPARPLTEPARQVCRVSQLSFIAGERNPTTLYLRPVGALPQRRLDCAPMTARLQACRSPDVAP